MAAGALRHVLLLTNEERRDQLQTKVEELKVARLSKHMARDRWRRWKSEQKYKRVGAAETDYRRWDTWCPSDDSGDELPPAPPPDSAEFRAMEEDIDRRALDKEARHVTGEEWKAKGNDALAEGMPGKAFKCYTKGLESDKSSRALLLNRALAALRLNNKQVTVLKLGEDIEVGSYGQAVEDCGKVLDIAEFLCQNQGPGVKAARVKAHMRRAAARHLLGSVPDALADVKDALATIDDLSAAETAELTALRDKYQGDLEEEGRIASPRGKGRRRLLPRRTRR